MFDNLLQLEKLAKNVLDKSIFDHIAGGSGEEISVKANHEAYSKKFLIPRVLVDVSEIDIGIKLLSRQLKSPIIIAPIAFHGLVNKNKEIATALAAEKTESLMIVSMMSNVTLEEIANSTNSPVWLQLHIHKKREMTKKLIFRAEKSGYEAIVITVDIPQKSVRYRDVINKFKFPDDCYPANFVLPGKNLNGEIQIDVSGVEFNPSATWEDITWIKSITKLPIFLKGVLHHEDAYKAISTGVDGIIISNHGGRQLDGVIPPISVLSNIANIVKGKIPILIDGCIRTGTDIVKAISLGASAILIGRPVMWGLAVAGEKGVLEVIEYLKRDLKLAMQLMGCPRLTDLKKDNVSAVFGNMMQEQYFDKKLKNSNFFDDIDDLRERKNKFSAKL